VITGPVTATAGVSGLYTVTAEDQFNNPVTNYAGTITITSGDSTLSSVIHTALSNGVEQFDVTLDTAGLQTVGAHDNLAHTASPSVSVLVSHAAVLTLTIAPTNDTIVAGGSKVYTVTGHDTFGNTWDATSTSDFSIGAGASCTANSCTSDTAGGYTVRAADHTTPSIFITTGLTVTHAAMNKLVLGGPASANRTVLASFTVTAEDQFGNVVGNYAGQPTITSGDSTATISDNTPAMASGVGHFDVTFNTLGDQTISAGDGTFTATDLTVHVLPSGSATHLVITGPATAVTTHVQDYTVTAENGSNVQVIDYTGDVTVTATGGSSSPTHANLVGGAGVFHVTFTTAGSPQTITAGDGTITGTLPVTVKTYGPATKFHVTGGTSGTAPSTQDFTVEAQDQYDTPVPDYAGTVAITSSDGGAVLPANSTLTDGTKVFSVTLLTAGTQTVTATDTVTHSITGVSPSFTLTRVANEYHGLPVPFRALDTRNGNGLPHGVAAKLTAHNMVAIPITGRGNVALSAVAITVNATIVKPSASSTLYLGPGAPPTPSNFTIAFNRADTTAYGVTVALSGGSVYATYQAASGSTDLVLDVTGYFSPDTTGQTYYPLTTPVRLLDTRVANGLSGKFKANVSRVFKVAGRGGVPLNAAAVTGNLTVTDANDGWAVYLGPTKTVSPSSTINFVAKQTRANGLTIALGSGGTLTGTYLSHTGKTCSLVFDVTGYYLPGAGGAKYVPLTPGTVLDTRAAIGIGAGLKYVANTPHNFPVRNMVGVPIPAVAVTGVISVMNQTANWAVYVGPVDVALPKTSVLNFVKGDTCSNGLVSALNSTTGNVSVTYMSAAGNTTNVVVFITGYFVPGS
jgi:hypothetical protein